jgi:hypothetical protein
MFNGKTMMCVDGSVDNRGAGPILNSSYPLKWVPLADSPEDQATVNEAYLKYVDRIFEEELLTAENKSS